ncbi:hypothetical protein Pla52o_34230 [Novipirellula galeiformis]|uniref:Uncharacterized protein n=1 Tax=Novipirellula galeiformis TaxID=2528004 RepID=A0A5C6CF50_9BACT|nr:hypothetical protein [Novipirellula galeiformis]TWU22367.1 hypothetical protein Pla52o_34230 [Novipirellula galeiformis]
MARRKWYRVLLNDSVMMLPYFLLVPFMVLARAIGTAFGANDYTFRENVREAIGPQLAVMSAVGLVYLAINGLRLRDWLATDADPPNETPSE